MNTAGSPGKSAPQASVIWVAPMRGQSAATSRRNAGIGMAGPCSARRRAVLRRPTRGQRLHDNIQHREPGSDLAEQDDVRHGSLPLAQHDLAHRPGGHARDAGQKPRLPGPAAALEDAHLSARATRGAAAALAELAPGARTVRFAGVGNVTGALVASGASHSLVSINGTLGHGVVKPREFSYAAPPGALLILASDGLATRWSLEAYPGLGARHPALVAAVLYRDFWRRRDDVTVVAVRLGGR